MSLPGAGTWPGLGTSDNGYHEIIATLPVASS